MAKKKRRKKRRQKTEPVHEFVAIRVDNHHTDCSASVNHNVYSPESAFRLDEDDPLFKFETRLVVTGTANYPEQRAGHRYEFTMRGDEVPPQGLRMRLKDVQVRGEYGEPQYRSYRGRQIPVYDDVRGIAFLDKIRGEDAWSALINVAPRLVSDMLILLESGQQLFLAVHEIKEGRQHWIREISLQTSDPAEE